MLPQLEKRYWFSSKELNNNKKGIAKKVFLKVSSSLNCKFPNTWTKYFISSWLPESHVGLDLCDYLCWYRWIFWVDFFDLQYLFLKTSPPLDIFEKPEWFISFGFFTPIFNVLSTYQLLFFSWSLIVKIAKFYSWAIVNLGIIPYRGDADICH